MSAPSRNDPCPCGSGKKYKQCCLKKNEASAATKRAETIPASLSLQAALVHHQAGRLAQAETIYQQILQDNPDNPDALHWLGVILHQTGKSGIAVGLISKAICLKPSVSTYHNNLGTAFEAQNKLTLAAASYRKAIELQKNYADAYVNLGAVLQKQGRMDESIVNCRKAIAINPGYAEAHYNLGVALQAQGNLEAAIASYNRARSLKPDYAEVYHNLGDTLQQQGNLDAAIMNLRKALAIKPDFAGAHGALLFCLNYHPDMSAEDIFAEYRRWNDSHAKPLLRQLPFPNDRSPARRLRIGYVSPDLRKHAVSHFIEPLLSCHNKDAVEVFAYAQIPDEDEVSLRLKGYTDHWLNTVGMSDDALDTQIRIDRIDILVDLAGHTIGNRLLVFARKPAPVSLSWLGYGYTTGLSAIDYYLADEVSAPAGSEGLFAEHPWRIANPACIYRPAPGMGDVNSLPAQQRGYVTFGTLSRSIRINHRTIRVWAAILNAVPNSRLILDSHNFKDSAIQERMATRFAEHGITRDRLEIGFHTPPWDTLRGMDIGLDCFPHNSGTTLFETLYMGIPYITLAARPSVGRLGSSLLHGVGHPEWVAVSEDDYVAKAVELASDLERLAAHRASLRTEMEQGPLMDEAGFARKMENAYREMFENWTRG